MKMTKKVLLGAAVLALVFGFAGCKNDDDPNDMIEGSGQNYTIAYTNESADVSRGYNGSTFNHRGQAVRFTLDTPNSDSGVLGFIWDLNTVDKATNARNFWVLGIQLNNDGKNVKYYVSKYFNVTDTQAWNFGAGTYNTKTHKGTAATITKADIATMTTTSGTKEYEKVTPTALGTFSGSSTSPIVVWADVYPIGDKHVVGTQDKNQTGAFGIQFYAAKEDGDINTDSPIGSLITIDTDETGYTTTPTRNTYAVYANVYANSSLNGAWYLPNKYEYADAEVIEDAE